MNSLNSALDSGLIPAALFLDVPKAFESLTHKILLLKLPHIGIRGNAYSWFLSYLSGLVISVHPDFSNPSGIEFGVQKGSVIGPILFLIYVNDLINAVKNLKPTIFCRLCQPVVVTKCEKSLSLPYTLIALAYDSILGTAGIDTSSRVGTLDDVSRGSLSTPKDRYIRFLGILLDENLLFKHHIDLIKMKVSKSLGILRKLKYIFPGSIHRILFCSLVQSYVSYCSVIWMSAIPSSLKPLSKLYDKARTLIQETNRFSLKPLLDLKSLYFLSCSSFIFFTVSRPSSCCPM